MKPPVILITGALTGIGRATALAFPHDGARIVVSGRRDDVGQALVTELRILGAEAEFMRADVQHEEDVRKLVDKTVERFGRLDVAVNNAGTEGQRGPITEQSAESYAAAFDTNVLGTLLSLKGDELQQAVENRMSIEFVFKSLCDGHSSIPFRAALHPDRRCIKPWACPCSCAANCGKSSGAARCETRVGFAFVASVRQEAS
jgi:NAD(P)-dependent dehydrogenase (short-subunit alcohol dehydrogenase family)